MPVDEEYVPERVGPYRISRKIGAGGMGNVYLGTNEETGQEAAVKVLPASLAREEGFVLRFSREVDAMRRLSSSHIVRIFDSGADGETYYYGMEYVDGETLTSRLRRDKRLPWRDVIDITMQVCSALKAAHDAGIIHRDLKPSNLMIANDGSVKLTDFGVAQVFAAGKLTVTGGVVGTAEYMSPEQAQGQKASKRSDLYSLGAVMYVMLTGRPPFSGSTQIEVIHKQRFGQFDRPKSYIPDLPSWLDDLVCQLLEKDPEKRPPDAFVLLRQLQQIVKKVELKNSERATVATGMGITVDNELTQVAPAAVQEAFGATFMSQMVRAEAERSLRGSWLSQLLDNTWILVTVFVLVVAGLIYGLTPRKLPPYEMFAQGEKLMDGPEGDAWLIARDKYFLPILKADPDEWKEKVDPYLQQIEVYELEKLLNSPRRRSRNKVRSEAERLLRIVKSDWDGGRMAEAEQRLKALEILLAQDPDETKLLSVVQHWLAEIKNQRAPRQSDFSRMSLNRAESFMPKQPQLARKMLTSLLVLYENDPSAIRTVERARRLLNELNAASPPTAEELAEDAKAQDSEPEPGSQSPLPTDQSPPAADQTPDTEDKPAASPPPAGEPPAPTPTPSATAPTP